MAVKKKTPTASSAPVKSAAPVAPASAAPKKNRVNQFSQPKFHDQTIVDADNKVVGHIRLKPNAMLYSPPNGKDWYGLPLEKFAELAQTHGKKQKK